MRYLVVGRHPWNRQHFDEMLSERPEQWQFAGDPASLQAATANCEDLRYIFFLHWSEHVPDSIHTRLECVCFHMTDLPYGRGGSPLQNLISSGHRETMLTALRMAEEFDAGPVFMKRPLSLEGGTAEEILARSSRLSCEMAIQIALLEPEPEEQVGDILTFRRRYPGQSELPLQASDLLSVFDHIRMLDAEGYPRAFLHVGNYKLEFTRAGLYHDGIRADVKISLIDATKGEDQ